ncbi:MAG: DNA-processing protein DprA [Candidatus Binataceae bacterium]
MTPTPDSYWVALRRIKGLGPRTAKLLLERFELPERIFAAGEAALAEAGISRTVARSIAEFRGFEELEKELCEVARLDARLIRWSDSEYPPNLRQIADPPPFLFARGTAMAEERQCVAVVGARIASDAGRSMARRLGFELAARGFTVVSGLARGIDAEAHQGALDSGGRTIAVMGCGIDIIYPPENHKLADEIVKGGGLIVSELPIGTPPLAENFPTRNRILSGLALGAVIVEASERSGSLITARMALEQDRQVFAVPGSPISGKAHGSNRLIKQGAVLVECVEDVIEELAPQLVKKDAAQFLGRWSTARTPAATPSSVVSALQALSKDAQAILSCLKDDEKLHVDSIIEASGLSPQTVLGFLLEMELKGMVQQHPGKLFSLA